MADTYHQVLQRRGQPLHEGFVIVKAPAGLACTLARTMHFVDALTRMHLVSVGQPVASVPFVYNGVKLSVLHGDAALAARRHVASKLTPSMIAALRRPVHIERPDWSLMQQLWDAGIGRWPVSHAPVFNPSACSPELRTALWHAYCDVATTVDTRVFGETGAALDELQTRLREHAAQLRETAPRARRLVLSDGTLTKRSRGASPASSLSDDGTVAGEPARERKLRPRRVINESDDEDEPAPMWPVAGSDITAVDAGGSLGNSALTSRDTSRSDEP